MSAFSAFSFLRLRRDLRRSARLILPVAVSFFLPGSQHGVAAGRSTPSFLYLHNPLIIPHSIASTTKCTSMMPCVTQCSFRRR